MSMKTLFITLKPVFDSKVSALLKLSTVLSLIKLPVQKSFVLQILFYTWRKSISGEGELSTGGFGGILPEHKLYKLKNVSFINGEC